MYVPERFAGYFLGAGRAIECPLGVVFGVGVGYSASLAGLFEEGADVCHWGGGVMGGVCEVKVARNFVARFKILRNSVET